MQSAYVGDCDESVQKDKRKVCSCVLSTKQWKQLWFNLRFALMGISNTWCVDSRSSIITRCFPTPACFFSATTKQASEFEHTSNSANSNASSSTLLPMPRHSQKEGGANPHTYKDGIHSRGNAIDQPCQTGCICILSQIILQQSEKQVSHVAVLRVCVKVATTSVEEGGKQKKNKWRDVWVKGLFWCDKENGLRGTTDRVWICSLGSGANLILMFHVYIRNERIRVWDGQTKFDFIQHSVWDWCSPQEEHVWMAKILTYIP